MTLDMNRDLHIVNDSYGAYIDVKDYSTTGLDGMTRVVFRNLEQRLIDEIRQAEMVVGCVAWLTSMPILDALSKRSTSIIVQKEDFLRPDLDARKGWARQLREAYGRLGTGLERHQMPGLVRQLSVCSDPTLDPIRCVGNHNRNRASAFPRSHHKFVLFCRRGPIECGHDPAEPNIKWYCAQPCTGVVPYRVWTGSFNFTNNATKSFENAVIMDDPVIVDAYFQEYAQIVALSEPLDWQTDWAEPEWRIGT